MSFQLNTSGTVAGKSWSDLSPFTQGYIEALLIEFDHSKGVRDPFMPRAFFRNLAPETLARTITDGEAWRLEYSERCRGEPPSSLNMGRCFWELRQAGKSEGFPPLTVYLGDDGKVRFTTPARAEERRAGE